jgi:hypothetical protein
MINDDLMNEPFQTKILLKTPLMVQISRNDISKQLKSQCFFGQMIFRIMTINDIHFCM